MRDTKGNSSKLHVRISDRLYNEIDKIRSERGMEHMSDAYRMMMWLGIKHYYLMGNKPDQLAAFEQDQGGRDQSSRPEIYIDKL